MSNKAKIILGVTLLAIAGFTPIVFLFVDIAPSSLQAFIVGGNLGAGSALVLSTPW